MKIDPSELPTVINRAGKPWAIVRSSIDTTLFLVTLLLAQLIAGDGFHQRDVLFSSIGGVIAYPGRLTFRRFNTDVALQLLLYWAVVCGSMLLLAATMRFVFPEDPRLLFAGEAALWAGLSLVALLLVHVITPRLSNNFWKMYRPIKAVIVGVNEVGLRLGQLIIRGEVEGQRLMGYADDRSPDRVGLPAHSMLVTRLPEVSRYVQENGVLAIYICLPMYRGPRVLKILEELGDTTASIYFVPDVLVSELIQGRVSNIGGLPVLAVAETPFVGTAGIVKRAIDLGITIAALPALLPILASIAVLVKTTSKGPAIFQQKRFGLDGREIVVWKFRTMSVMEDGDATYKQVTQNDSRVTPLGRILRKTSLDELPQLLNVLGGSMTLVGPRPHALAVNEQFRKLIPGYMVRHKVKPGITGWAQVNGYRGGDDLESMRKRTEYDLAYLRNWSPMLDLVILAKTAWMLIAGDKKAY